MNNEIMAIALVAMMFAFAASTPYVFGPAPFVFKAVEDPEHDTAIVVETGARRGR